MIAMPPLAERVVLVTSGIVVGAYAVDLLWRMLRCGLPAVWRWVDGFFSETEHEGWWQ